MTTERLPWERSGAPRGVGISLSGGGLRAASFSMGAVQALQQERGLLHGETSADFLAVVSGGSYLGATDILNAARGEPAPGDARPPVMEGTPEASHIVTHGSYLKTWGTASKMGLGGVVNVAAFVAVFVWSGVMLAALITTAAKVHIGPVSDSWLRLGAVVVFLIGGRLLLRGLYLDGGPGRALLPPGGFLLLTATAASTLAAMRQTAALSDAGWWGRGSAWLIAALGCALVIGTSVAVAHFLPHHTAARVSVWISARVPAFIGAVLFCLVATGVARSMDRAVSRSATLDDTVKGLAILFGALIAAAVMQMIARTSLHGMYRDSLARCFSIARKGSDAEPVAPTVQKLSDLAPPASGCRDSFPRLLICATANVIWDPGHPSRSPLFRLPARDREKFASFVYSHDRCGLPGVDGASFATTDLERLTTRAGIRARREPLVSLMSGVASTGAAISPAMGRKTSDVLRPLLALSNLRLGRWLPNPLSPRIRSIVEGTDADSKMISKKGFGGSYDEFLPELFGLHHSDAPRVYISDGGHYDNLGLVALLQARCREIWCVDAEADPQGRARQLRAALDLASSALGVGVEIDLTVLPGPAAGVLGQAYVIGQITYSDGAQGRLVVIKLGLTADSDSSLHQYATEDRGFPYHSTFWPPFRVMWYGPDRFDSYRKVGFANALSAARA